jgi:hypothetical protein
MKMKKSNRIVSIRDTFSTDDLEIPEGSSMILEKLVGNDHLACTWSFGCGTVHVIVRASDFKPEYETN